MKGSISNDEIYISYPKAISYHGCDMQQVMRQAVRVMLWRMCVIVWQKYLLHRSIPTTKA